MTQPESVQIPDSDRLQYRLMTVGDHSILWQLDQDPDVMKYITLGQITSRERMQEHFLPRLTAYTNAENGWGLWACERPTSLEFVGWVLIRPMGFFDGQRDDRNLEIGWRFHRAFWGQGLATEAARSVAAELIRQKRCDRLSALAIQENTASINVMKKLGLQFKQANDYDDEYGKYRAVEYSAAVSDVITKKPDRTSPD